METELIAAIENLTDSVSNLSGHIEELKMSFTSNNSKMDILSGKLEDSTKSIQKLTGEVNALRFK